MLHPQVMGVGVMESEHVSLDAAGHPPSQLLVSLLVVLCNHGSDIRNVDRWVQAAELETWCLSISHVTGLMHGGDHAFMLSLCCQR